MNWLVNLLIWIGLTRRLSNGKLFKPWHIPPKEKRLWFGKRSWLGKWHGWAPYIFRNKSVDPWFHRRSYKRLLPWRWGFGWMGFEFGDRGGEHVIRPATKDSFTFLHGEYAGKKIRRKPRFWKVHFSGMTEKDACLTTYNFSVFRMWFCYGREWYR